MKKFTLVLAARSPAFSVLNHQRSAQKQRSRRLLRMKNIFGGRRITVKPSSFTSRHSSLRLLFCAALRKRTDPRCTEVVVAWSDGCPTRRPSSKHATARPWQAWRRLASSDQPQQRPRFRMESPRLASSAACGWQLQGQAAFAPWPRACGLASRPATTAAARTEPPARPCARCRQPRPRGTGPRGRARTQAPHSRPSCGRRQRPRVAAGNPSATPSSRLATAASCTPAAVLGWALACGGDGCTRSPKSTTAAPL